MIVLQFLQVNVRGSCSGLVRFKDSEANGRRKEAEFWWKTHHLVP